MDQLAGFNEQIQTDLLETLAEKRAAVKIRQLEEELSSLRGQLNLLKLKDAFDPSPLYECLSLADKALKWYGLAMGSGAFARQTKLRIDKILSGEK